MQRLKVYLNNRKQIMTELSSIEVEEVNGGIIPIIIAGALASGKGLAAGFGLGMAVGAIWALAE
jgi:lactobin A/cerein 7B family class IIb bacteriocin